MQKLNIFRARVVTFNFISRRHSNRFSQKFTKMCHKDKRTATEDVLFIKGLEKMGENSEGWVAS